MNLARKATIIALLNAIIIVAILLKMPTPATSLPTSTVATMEKISAPPVAKKVSLPSVTSQPAAKTIREIPVPLPDNRCIIVVQGHSYNVTDLRSTHSGGDIFQCGTDMTALFFGQHEQQLLNTTMKQYLIQ